MPNPIIGVRRALARMRPGDPTESESVPSRSRDAAHRATPLDRLRSVRTTDVSAVAETARQAPRRLAGSLSGLSGRERALPIAVAGLVVAASILSVGPTTGSPSQVDQTSPRIAIGGGVLGPSEADPDLAPDLVAGSDAAEQLGAPANALAAEADAEPESFPMSRFLADGTLLKPIAVDPTVPDASERLQTYEVKAGDTLTGIANKFGVSMMTVWWANDLKSKDDLKRGQKLIIPPVDGLVVTVKEGDTLDSLAAANTIETGEIIAYNGLMDADLVVGQVLVLPGARGEAIATPTPKPTPKPTARPRSSSSGGGGGGGGGSAPSYSGGRLAWPMPGHRIIQYYRSGHHGLDIAAKTGDRVYAAAAGTVVYAGWKNNGGGYVVWINHGSGLYTTYNHLSRVLVSKGQRVARSQAVGRAGATGWAYGAHLHFEVTRGYPWANGRDNRVNPLAYY